MSKTQETKTAALFSARDILNIYDICTNSVDAVYQIALICGIKDFVRGLDYLRSAIPSEPDDLLIDPRVLVKATAGQNEVEIKAAAQPSQSVETCSDATLPSSVPLTQHAATSISRTPTISHKDSNFIQYEFNTSLNGSKAQQNCASSASSTSATRGVGVQPAITAAGVQPHQAAVDPYPLQLSSPTQGATSSYSASLASSSNGAISNPGNQGSYEKSPILGTATESRHRVAPAPAIRRTMTAPSPKITAPFKPSPLRTQLPMGNETSNAEGQRRAPSAQPTSARSSSGPRLTPTQMTPPPRPVQRAAEVPHSAVAVHEVRISSPQAWAQVPTGATPGYYPQLPQGRSTNSTEYKSNDTRKLDIPSQHGTVATVPYYENVPAQVPPQNARAQTPHREAAAEQAVPTSNATAPTQQGFAQQLPPRYNPNPTPTVSPESRQYASNPYAFYYPQKGPNATASTPYTLYHAPRQYAAPSNQVEASLAADGFAIIENPAQQRQMAAPAQSSLGKRRAEEIIQLEPGYPEVERPTKRARSRA